MSNVTIIGDGGWGTALALVLHRNGHAITLWGPFADYLDTIRTQAENPRYLPGVTLPREWRWTSEPGRAIAGADAVVLAVPSRYYAATCDRFRGLIPAGADVISVTKGLCPPPHVSMSRLAEERLAHGPVAVLSGPSHAEEVARGIPTAVVAASADAALAGRVQTLFGQPVFRVYSSDDPLGVELGGALKNVIALAIGVSDGIGFGDNTRAALITRGLVEITRLGTALGARAETFAGLSGMGDLIVTCTSRHSRNRGVGERIGRGEPVDTILADMQMAAEGVWNCAAAAEAAQRLGVEVPITTQVNALIEGRLTPQEAVCALLERDPKPEAH